MLDNLDAMIVPVSSKPLAHDVEVQRVRNLLAEKGQLTAGTLLIRNPYETAEYENADIAMESFANAKYHAFANVSRILGAKSVHFVDAKVERNTSSQGGNAKFTLAWFKGNADVKKEISKKLDQRIEGHMKFSGGAPALDEARDYLNRRNLGHDQQMRDLVDMRSGINPIVDYTMKLSGTKEAAENFACALSIAASAPVKALSIGANFTKTARAISSIEMTTKIQF